MARQYRKYGLEKEDYLFAKYYALQYAKWLDEYNCLKDSVGAIVYDGMPHGSTPGDPTASLAARHMALREKMGKVEEAAMIAAPDFYQYILEYAVTPGANYTWICQRGVPCERATFYERRRKFYWELWNAIK